MISVCVLYEVGRIGPVDRFEDYGPVYFPRMQTNPVFETVFKAFVYLMPYPFSTKVIFGFLVWHKNLPGYTLSTFEVSIGIILQGRVSKETISSQ